MQPDFEPISPARIDWDGATPFAADYGDGYFSRADGLGESRAVFIDANDLPGRFARLRPGESFVIGETGFGTGLNALQAARLFSDTAADGARLTLLSAELHPLAPADLARATGGWPDLDPWRRALIEQYPPMTPGFHRVRLAPGIELVLMFGDALAMWREQPAGVDAWFLDGFAPDRNPAMWQPALFEQLAAHARPGCTLGTFTVAGKVRRGLAEAGFRVERQPGFGDKRQRLVGRAPGHWSARRIRAGRATVAGAGLAGATTARALAERGWAVRVIDPDGPASGASGNRVGVVYTTPSGVATPQNRFYQSSYLRALQWFARHACADTGIGRFDGVVQHVTGDRQRRKLRSATQSGHWPPGLLDWLDDDRVLLPQGGVLRPPAWCRYLLDHPSIQLESDRVAAAGTGGVRLASGREVDQEPVVLCIGGAAMELTGLPGLPLKQIRGQVSECAATEASSAWQRARCHDGYLTPAVDGVHCVGATFDIGDGTRHARDTDDARNIEQLRSHLPGAWRELGGEHIEVVGRRVGFRCQSSDFLPLAGPADDDSGDELILNLAHGSRGLTDTPLAAELIADSLSGLPPAVDGAMAAALSPLRFARRAARRKRRPGRSETLSRR